MIRHAGFIFSIVFRLKNMYISHERPRMLHGAMILYFQSVYVSLSLIHNNFYVKTSLIIQGNIAAMFVSKKSQQENMLKCKKLSFI